MITRLIQFLCFHKWELVKIAYEDKPLGRLYKDFRCVRCLKEFREYELKVGGDK